MYRSPSLGQGARAARRVPRPVRPYAQLRDFETLLRRMRPLRTGGATTAQMATTFNREGFVPPKRSRPLSKALVGQRLDRQGWGDERRVPARLGPDEWWLGPLARALQMSPMQLRDWVVRGWLHARKSPAQGLWIVWADAEERARVGSSSRRVGEGCTCIRPPTPRPSRGLTRRQTKELRWPHDDSPG